MQMLLMLNMSMYVPKYQMQGNGKMGNISVGIEIAYAGIQNGGLRIAYASGLK